MELAIYNVNERSDDVQPLEHHHTNWGVLIQHNGIPKSMRICWCRLHHLFKTQDLIDEVILDDANRPLHCYRLINVPSDMPINKVVSQAQKKNNIRGPVYFCYDDFDIQSHEILDYLLSR